MKSLMRRLKRRRTSFSESEVEPPSEVFELQRVPDHKKRNHKPESHADEKEEREQQERPPEFVLLEPPAVILTTPDGLDIDTFAHGLMDIVDESSDGEDEWDALIPPPLLAEPPKTPTKRRPPPPRPQRPADLSFNTFVLGPPEVPEIPLGSDFDTTLVSPFADPQDVEEEEAPSSWWSSWSSSDDASSDSSSSSDDSESDEMNFQYEKHTAGKTLYAQLTDGFVSFPPLSPDGSDDMAMKSFLDDLDEEDVRDAEELLKGAEGDDDMIGNDGTDELIKAVASGERDWANAFSRPVPRWLWLKASNSLPVYRLGPNDLRHGHSKLRQAMSMMDEVGSGGIAVEKEEEEEKVARAGVLYL